MSHNHNEELQNKLCMLQRIRRNKKYSPKNKAREDTQMKVEDVMTVEMKL